MKSQLPKSTVKVWNELSNEEIQEIAENDYGKCHAIIVAQLKLKERNT